VLFSVEMGTTYFYPSNSSLINNLHFWKSWHTILEILGIGKLGLSDLYQIYINISNI
jgi:hypothetical protein